VRSVGRDKKRFPPQQGKGQLQREAGKTGNQRIGSDWSILSEKRIVLLSYNPTPPTVQRTCTPIEIPLRGTGFTQRHGEVEEGITEDNTPNKT
jgi:hypothetical protein